MRIAEPQLAAVEVRGLTRSAFILRGALAAGAVYGGTAVGPFVKGALTQETEAAPDVDALNFALTLEILEATFYEQALQEVSGLSGDLRALTEELRDNEDEHVDLLTKTVTDVGGEPVSDPTIDFGDALASVNSYLRLAQTLEDTGVMAYDGVAPTIQDKSILATLGTIVQVEARHAALIRAQRDEEIAPSAFEETLDRSEVVEEIEPFMET